MSPRPTRRHPVLAAALLGATALAVLGLSDGGRTVLRQSFTHLPVDYNELYFTNPPRVGSDGVTVPVTLVEHGTRPTTYQLRAQVEDGSGRVTAQSTTNVAARPGEAARAVILLPAGTDPSLVQVALTGHPQTLRYRIGGPPPAPGGAP